MDKTFLRMLVGAMVLMMSFTGCGTEQRLETQPSSSQEAVSAETVQPGSVEDAASGQLSLEGSGERQNDASEEENLAMKIQVLVNGETFTATMEQNRTADAFLKMVESGPITLQLSDYAGFEKVGPLGQSLPTDNHQTTTRAGDIVLYQGNQIVIFYGSNSWSYTRLGKIDDLTGWEEALGRGDASVTFSLAQK